MASFKSDFLQTLSERDFIHQGSDLEGLDALLLSGVQSAYIGFDATAPSLHVGSLMQIMMLYWFQQTGHKPISLMGGGTTKVGDPSGKDDSRKLMDDASINTNISSIKNVFAQYLKYGADTTDALMINNNDWLANINYIDFLRDYGRHFSVNRMLSFDSVRLRLDREQPLSFLEFNYMILQAYDFLELNRRYGTILQLGGSDQWGNIINGVELIRRVDAKNSYALTCPLITTSSGAKMGKTAQGAVWLNADMKSPYDYYQFWRNTEDGDVGKFLKFYTLLPIVEISKLEKLGGAEINEAKKILAFEATKLCHGETAAFEAAETARKTFEEGQTGGSLPSFSFDLSTGMSVIDLLVKSELSPSKTEARKLIQGGGARVNDCAVNDEKMIIGKNDVGTEGFVKLSAGKKRHVLIRSS